MWDYIYFLVFVAERMSVTESIKPAELLPNNDIQMSPTSKKAFQFEVEIDVMWFELNTKYDRTSGVSD